VFPKAFIPGSQIQLMRPCISCLAVKLQEGFRRRVRIGSRYVAILSEIETPAINEHMGDMDPMWPQLASENLTESTQGEIGF
jgi:hypothetical protein